MRQVQAILMLPDFCWMTFAEVLAYIEQLSDDADYFSLGPLLTYLVRRGDIERKRSINLERNKAPSTSTCTSASPLPLQQLLILLLGQVEPHAPSSYFDAMIYGLFILQNHRRPATLGKFLDLLRVIERQL
jgi:hypothetical protein